MPEPSGVFSAGFLDALRFLVNQHHLLYPRIPPRDIFFESLVEKSFKTVSAPFSHVEPTARNAPKHDLAVGDVRISVKTETGEATKLSTINMTKLCTTERNPWTPQVLVERVMDHLSQYDVILMLRAVWNGSVIRYQIAEIPVLLLRKIADCNPRGTGKRKERQSLGADVFGEQGETLFHVHFDGSDGKCQIRNLPVSACVLLSEWEYQVRD